MADVEGFERGLRKYNAFGLNAAISALISKATSAFLKQPIKEDCVVSKRKN